MRAVVFVFVVFGSLVACTRPNPNTCCVTQAQCDELGADELRPCEAGQACRANSCVASECESSSECTSSDAPICILNLCSSTCVSDAECADVSMRPYCSESACVGCVESVQCPTTAAICDPDAHSCRGCENDDECATGVCLETQGVCAEESALIFVHVQGADSGTCSRTAPCASIGYAYQRVNGLRNVIRIIGGTLDPEPQTISVTSSVILDGTGTVVSKPATAIPWMSASVFGTVTIEGLTIRGNTNPADPTIAVSTGLQLGRGAVIQGVVSANNATLVIRDANLEAPVVMSGGTLDGRFSRFRNLETSNTQVSVSRSHFEADRAMVYSTGGMVIMENNLFVQTTELSDSIFIMNVVPGSRFRFNTVVSTAGVDSDGKALDCDATLAVASNVFAHRSRHPHGYLAGCQTRFSLYDDVVVAIPTAPVSSQTGSIGTFFVSLAGKDFHLGVASPARGNADPGSPIGEDYDGNMRPRPAGTNPDIGAFEAP